MNKVHLKKNSHIPTRDRPWNPSYLDFAGLGLTEPAPRQVEFVIGTGIETRAGAIQTTQYTAMRRLVALAARPERGSTQFAGDTRPKAYCYCVSRFTRSTATRAFSGIKVQNSAPNFAEM